MSKKHKYEVIIGNIGTMHYTSKKLAYECFNTYKALSMQSEGRASGEPVTLFCDSEIIQEHNPQNTENEN